MHAGLCIRSLTIRSFFEKKKKKKYEIKIRNENNNTKRLVMKTTVETLPKCRSVHGKSLIKSIPQWKEFEKIDSSMGEI